MTQTVAATCVLGPGLTGLAIGVTVLNIDGTEYAAFSTSGVAETSVAGTYRKADGVVVPDAGGYLVWGVSGTDYAEATVEPKPAYTGDEMDLVDAPNATAVAAIQSGLATPTNITAGTITTVTNLTNAPTNGDLTAVMKASVNAEIVDVLRIDTIPDDYAADGDQPTFAQAILAIQQYLFDKSLSGTTLIVKKPDGSSTAMTFTLDAATAPTSQTRSA